MESGMCLLSAAAGLLGAGLTLWGGYYLVTALLFWRGSGRYDRSPARTRFAVLVAARNEELVIGSLVDSLRAQDYPDALYDIWVIPNGCTDATAAAAGAHGASILRCTVSVYCKGDVLRFAFQQLSGQGYDAFCVFDADNVVHPAFLREMNNAICSGALAAQGRKDSKNPHDSAMSGCYSIYHWTKNRFYNGGKAGLGLSAMICGTGFMLSAAALERLGGWHTESITEDLELSIQCARAGIRVVWVPGAITYDEQPLTFGESVKQRRRWISGTIQLSERWLPALGRQLLRHPSAAVLDVGATLLVPAYQMATLVNLALSALATGFVQPGRFLPLLCLQCAAGGLLSAALGGTLSAALVLTLEGKWSRKMGKALACYWLFLLSWVLITVLCFFKKTTRWEEIRHTRNIAPQSIQLVH